jgi:hypothetical protein
MVNPTDWLYKLVLYHFRGNNSFYIKKRYLHVIFYCATASTVIFLLFGFPPVCKDFLFILYLQRYLLPSRKTKGRIIVLNSNLYILDPTIQS